MYMAGLHLALYCVCNSVYKSGAVALQIIWLSIWPFEILFGNIYASLVDGQTYIRLKAQIDVYVYNDSCSVDCQDLVSVSKLLE